MIKLFLSAALFWAITFLEPVTWLKNIDDAKGQAQKEHKYILLNFSGSDWCIPCMRLEHDVFNADAFTRYATDNLVLLNADFPREKKNQLSREQQKLNDVLAERYNPQGSFPFTLLLDSDGNKIKIWDGYYKDGAEGFINEIKVITEKNNLMLPKAYNREMKLMGNRFGITVVAHTEEWANEMINEGVKEIQRIEKLLTTFNDDSETNLINKYAGIQPVHISSEVYNIIERSIRISSVTQGAFDITYGGIDKKLWNFDETMKALPPTKKAKKMVRLINYKNIVLDKENQTVFLCEKGMRIGFGGIGKGYAAEMAKEILKKKSVDSGIVNASGDLTAWGTQPDGKPWTVGIVHPDYKEYPFSYLNISDMAVATSGNYEKFVIINGKRYSHTIDPRTGMPVSGIKSVTVISPNAEISDAMATPVMVMGVRHGLDLINQLKQIECVIIDDNNKIYTSKNINCA